MTVPVCPYCKSHTLNLPILCKGAYQPSHSGLWFVKCLEYISLEECAAGGIPACTFFRWITAERAKALIFDNLDWEVMDHLQQQGPSMQRSFCLSGTSASSSTKTWTICGIQGCGKRAAAFCGVCKVHCHNSGHTNVCGTHGYPGKMPNWQEPCTAGLANLSISEPLLIDVPSDGIENHDEFSWHIDLDWELHLINDGSYTAEPLAMAMNAGTPASTAARPEAAAPAVDHARRRDQEMANKECTITVTVFAKDGKQAEHFNIAVLSKDWPSFIPRKYQIILHACGITADDLEHFQKHDNGLWVNYRPGVVVQKGDKVVLQFSSETHPIGEQSPTKVIQMMQGCMAASVLTLSSSSVDNGPPIKEIIDLSISDEDEEDEDEELYAFIRQTSALSVLELPASTGCDLSKAEPNTLGCGDRTNAWPFKHAVDQHECFVQVEKLLTQEDIKVADAFLKVVLQSMHWVEGIWYHHYCAWKAIKNSGRLNREALVATIKAGRTEEGEWGCFAPKKG
ncbi:hypothetical protein F5146DRAFT_1142105 [Armillaria mellea]|nr:hypothetical protein F5146DRAFT_1142105 [Armillaria mellea]